MKIIETTIGEPDFELFEKLPAYLYPVGSCRLQQNENINNEFLHACYVLMENDQPITRLALYKNPHLVYRKLKTFCIGNYESTDNELASQTLIAHALQQAKESGAQFIIGPMNGSTFDNYRFSLQNDHPNFLLEPHHHLYYNDQFVSNGFEIISRYSSHIHTVQQNMQHTTMEKEYGFLMKGVRIRDINMDQYEEELKKLYPFICGAFQSNFLYTPVNWKTFHAKYMEASHIIRPEHILIAEDEQGTCIGFVFSYDDLFNQHTKNLIVKTIARAPHKQWSGLGHVLLNRLTQLAMKENYQFIVHAFIREGGVSTALSTDFSAVAYKKYALYGRAI